jgi:hypothetical protein
MIKEYIDIQNVFGKTRKMAILVCEACHQEKEIRAVEADQGRRYCSRECLANDKGFGLKKIVKL